MMKHPHQEELRDALEAQISERHQRLRSRKHYVEPKIGSSPQPSTPPVGRLSALPEAPRYSDVSPERSVRYAREDGRRSVSPDVSQSKGADLRAALEEQIAQKRRLQQELIERERLASRELLSRFGNATEAAVAVQRVPSRFDRLPAATPLPPHADATRPIVPPTWHSHEFMDLSRKEEEEKKRKQLERQKAEELRLELERQIRDKELAQKRLLENERRTEREHEEKQLRIRQDAALIERRKQEENARQIVKLQEENQQITKRRRGESPTRSSAGGAAVAEVGNSPTSKQQGDVYSALRTESPSLFMSPIPTDGGVPMPMPASADNDLRSILSRIHRELLLQRQDLLSPSIFATAPYARSGLPVQRYTPSPLRLGEELPADRQFVVAPNTAAAARASKPPIFSMTSWMGTPTVETFGSVNGGGAADTSASLYGNIISDVLKKNQDRLRQLKYAKHHDDILRIFLSQDTPAGVTNATTDLPPPSLSQQLSRPM